MSKIWKFEDDINTDIITPGRFNLTTDPKELAKCCFCEVRSEFPEKVQKGDIIVAGKNFGCGSSRETAPLAIKAAGIKVIIAESFARIFYRNAINLALPVIVIENASKIFQEGDEIEFNVEKNTLNHKGKNIDFEPFPEFIQDIFKAGGLINYIDR